MNSKKRAIIFLCVLLVTVWLTGSGDTRALACSCFPQPMDAALKYSDAVFVGTVTNVEYLDDPKQTNPEPRIIVTFAVGRSWKGVTSREVVVHTIYNLWTCHGYYFHKDKEYLVFAYRNGPDDAKRFEPHKMPEVSLGVGLCGRTKLLSVAKDDLAVLGEGTVPK